MDDELEEGGGGVRVGGPEGQVFRWWISCSARVVMI